MARERKGARQSKDARENRERPRLSREAIVKAAMDIVDREGFRALSMRRLGAELGVDPMAVYYYIPDKSALMDVLAEAVMRDIDLTQDDPSRPVAERLLWAAHAYREALLKHPQAVETVALRPLRTPEALRPVETLLGILRDGGFSPTDALAAVDIFAIFVRGAAIRDAQHLLGRELGWHEQKKLETLHRDLPPDEFPILLDVFSQVEFVGLEEEFDRGARALIAGLLQANAKNTNTEV